MNSYEIYLEKMLEMKDKEISLYKTFIEKQLGCNIREEIRRNKMLNNGRIKEERYKRITIPESIFVIYMGAEKPFLD